MYRSIDELADGVRNGNRRDLSKAITLIESTRTSDRDASAELLDLLLPDTGGSIRVAITGLPGVGKSSFIESLGTHLVESGKRVAVLSIDPSSQITGGSILGDKTRMAELSRLPDAFIRPTPAGTVLGGVAARTRETVWLCEAAGFDITLIETVGVGQSEVSAHGLADLFLLMLLPAAGDELQGVKRGVLEYVDMLLVSKADGDLRDAALSTASDYQAALRLLRSNERDRFPDGVPVRTVSSKLNQGIAEAAEALVDHWQKMSADGTLQRKRTQQRSAWIEQQLQDELHTILSADESVASRIAELKKLALQGELSPRSFTDKISKEFKVVSIENRTS